MASLLAMVSPPPLFFIGKQTLLTIPQITTTAIATAPERQGRLGKIITKATSDSSESLASLSVTKSVQSVWENPEDRLALFGFGFAAVVALWASTNLVSAIDKLPLVPSAFELIGILYSTWFVYRYLLFKPNREELSRGIKKKIIDILGQ